MRIVIGMLCAVGITGGTFAAVHVVRARHASGAAVVAKGADDGSCPYCDAGAAPVLLMDSAAAASAPASQPAVDVKNTKCMVMPDDDVTPGKTVTYQGKIYHFCCDDCPKEFLKDPEKYIKAMNADPKKYGVK